MGKFIVRIDHLSNDELSFYGWELVDVGAEFSTFWNARYNEFQPVSNEPPRYIVIDDWNDAQSMGRGKVIAAP
jgi:hypothetical protein